MDFARTGETVAAADYRKKMEEMAASARWSGDDELAEHIMDYERNVGPEYRSPDHLELYVARFDDDR